MPEYRTIPDVGGCVIYATYPEAGVTEEELIGTVTQSKDGFQARIAKPEDGRNALLAHRPTIKEAAEIVFRVWVRNKQGWDKIGPEGSGRFIGKGK